MSEEQVAEVSAEVAPSVAVSDDWRSNIPEDIRGHKSFETINDVGALAKSFINAQSMIGREQVPIPGKYATDDDWKAVDARLGRPETPAGYELENNIAEGMTDMPEMLDGFRAAAHEVGLRPGQAQGLLNWYNEQMGGQVEVDSGQVDQIRENATMELKREYGPAFDDRISNASAVLQEFGQADLADVQLADGSALGDHPEMVRMMVNVSQFISGKIGEDTLEGMKSSGAMTPNDIEARIGEVIGKPGEGPYWERRHPGHEAAKAEVTRLMHMKTGEEIN